MTPRLYVINGLITVRLVPELAMEIGLHESLILLQVDYLLSIKGMSFSDDPLKAKWIKCSDREMQSKFFPFWSVSTIDRTINEMAERGLLILGNFNSDPKDTTRWMTYGPECVNLLAAKMLESGESPVAKPKAPKESKPKEPGIYDIAMSLAIACHVDFEMNKGRMLKEAKSLGAVTPDKIHELFGDGGVWYRVDWRGKAGSPPSPSQVRAEWVKMLEAQNNHVLPQGDKVFNTDGSINA